MILFNPLGVCYVFRGAEKKSLKRELFFSSLERIITLGARKRIDTSEDFVPFQ